MGFAACRWIILLAMNKLFEILKPFIDPKAVDKAVFYVPNNALTADELKVLYSYHTDFTAERVFIPHVTNHVGTRYIFSSDKMNFMVTVFQVKEPSDNIDNQG